MAAVAPPRGANPFDDSGVCADTAGVRRYPGLHASLVQMLRESVRAAPDVAVIGVPDAMMGEKVGAVVVPLPGATVDPRTVVDYARGQLADFKVPQFVVVSAAPLPRNPNGKVLKGPLRDTDFGAPLFG